MNQRFLMWGLASIAFVVTLALTSQRDGLWQSDQTIAPTHNIRTASSFTTEDSVAVPARPFAPAHAAPPPPVETVTAVTPPPPDPAPPQEAPPPPVETEQVSAQELDEQDFQSHRERAAERSARSR
jgi:type IV secretory pathway VirB10-like protein